MLPQALVQNKIIQTDSGEINWERASQILNLNFYHQWRLLDESWYYIQSQGRYAPTDDPDYTDWKIHNYKIVDIKLEYWRLKSGQWKILNKSDICVCINGTIKPPDRIIPSDLHFPGYITIGDLLITTIETPSSAGRHYFTCQAYIIKVGENEYIAIFINHPRNVYNEQTGKFELLVSTAHDIPVALPQFGLETPQFISIQSFNSGNSHTIDTSNFLFPAELDDEIIDRRLCLITDTLFGRILNNNDEFIANVPVTITRQWITNHWSYLITVPNISQYPSNFKLELY